MALVSSPGLTFSEILVEAGGRAGWSGGEGWWKRHVVNPSWSLSLHGKLSISVFLSLKQKRT